MREATRLRWSRWPICRHFNPRLPCGRRLPFLHCPVEDLAFQSPPPMREATALHLTDARALIISIPASHAGGDSQPLHQSKRARISIPASHAGGDAGDTFEYEFGLISIPASHAGGDPNCGEILGRHLNFNPRLPCGRRPFQLPLKHLLMLFQSPPPMREATATYCVAHYIFTRYSQIS